MSLSNNQSLYLSDLYISGTDLDGNSVSIDLTANTTNENLSGDSFFELSVTNDGVNISLESQGSLHLSDLNNSISSVNTTTEKSDLSGIIGGPDLSAIDGNESNYFDMNGGKKKRARKTRKKTKKRKVCK